MRLAFYRFVRATHCGETLSRRTLPNTHRDPVLVFREVFVIRILTIVSNSGCQKVSVVLGSSSGQLGAEVFGGVPHPMRMNAI